MRIGASDAMNLLCVNCVHYSRSDIISFAHICNRNVVTTQKVNLVTGKLESQSTGTYLDCNKERNDDYKMWDEVSKSCMAFDICGTIGRFWKQKLQEDV